MQRDCSTRSAVAEGGVTMTVSGSWRKAWASCRMLSGMVAENIWVWRCPGNFGHDFFQGRGEAHVQHVVGFIQNQGFHLVQIDGLAFQMVDQPARRSNQNVQARRQFAELGGIPHAAEDDGRGQVLSLGIRRDVVVNL